MDASGWVVASILTDDQAPDPSQVLGLLAQVNGEVDRFGADGIYDQAPVYSAVAQQKRESVYYLQSYAENVFFRYQTILGGRLRSRRTEAQEREAAIGCAVLNRMRELGRLQSYPVR